ncbi:hypothetical protein KFK09_015082 [Dendrobium nobile]|uniref:Uncharacterized protein n=1 Tax=Dendrobium nobile TaxID=94219 RepID=A0A8T3B3T2_DENNO|nr:hypothetical protein KFK09_015082 [Dendrobium nobile]
MQFFFQDIHLTFPYTSFQHKPFSLFNINFYFSNHSQIPLFNPNTSQSFKIQTFFFNTHFSKYLINQTHIYLPKTQFLLSQIHTSSNTFTLFKKHNFHLLKHTHKKPLFKYIISLSRTC